jgi:hypothetical protein
VGALKNEFTWSNRRGSTFEECLRRYWFESYGHWGGWEERAPERTRQIYMLKKVKHRQMWIGELVHEAAADALNQIRQGREPKIEASIGAMLERMRVQFRQSKNFEYRKNPKYSCALFEHEYGVPLSDDEWQQMADHAKKCLRNFFQCPFVDQMRQIPKTFWLQIEQLESFDLNGTKVWVKMDAAFRALNGRIVILDWKTGKLDPDPDPIQLTCYAIFAMQKWNVPAHEVDTVEYNLAENEYVFRPINAQAIEEVRSRITASIDAMKRYLVGAAIDNVPLPESAFPVSKDAAACKRCVFLKVCPDSPVSAVPARPRPGELF